MDRPAQDFIRHFRVIQDPRIERTKLHPLENILFISLCAVLSGADSWVEMQTFGEAKKEWLAKYLNLSNGIPSHDTFARVFAQLSPDEFQKGFLSWIQNVYQKTQGEIISIDGKTLRRSHNHSTAQEPLHLISAWAHANHLVMGQLKSQGHANEILSIPKLLEILDLHGCIVTLDAMGTQKTIAKAICDKKADYVLALKANHGLLYQELLQYWKDPLLPAHEYHCYETTEKDHGRLEIRRYKITSQIDWLSVRKDWAGLQSIAVVESQRTIRNQTTTETRLYLTSLKPNAKELAKAIRAHWDIENKLHWSLDVCFREDQSRARIKFSAENFARLRRLALNILKKDTLSKKSLRVKRLQAALNDTYLDSLLSKN
jgi:predicted transposase YbfD/YdcC